MDIQELESKVENLKAEIDDLKKGIVANKMTISVISGELDKIYSAFVLATGGVAMGMEVVMYFTFWALAAMRDKNKVVQDKEEVEKMLGINLPRDAEEVGLAKTNIGGIDTAAFKALMEKSNIPSLKQMISMAAELGVRIYLSDKSTEMLGFTHDEFIDYPGLDFAGVGTFLNEAKNSKVQLFI